MVDTGANPMTAGRIKRIENHVNGESFMFTYGDGLSDVNLNDLNKVHEKSGKYATLTAVQPEGRFSALNIDSNTKKVIEFKEKPKSDNIWINDGFCS